MNIFISWSGERSKTAALGLKSLLEDVFVQAVTVFISDHINPGENWGQRLGAELEKSQFGILCLTEDNFQAPWLLFEAGALAKKFAASRVVPFETKRSKSPGTERTASGASTAAVEPTAKISAKSANRNAGDTDPSGNAQKKPSAPRVVACTVAKKRAGHAGCDRSQGMIAMTPDAPVRSS